LHSRQASIGAFCFAIGAAVLCAGLIIHPLLLLPLGSGLVVGGGVAWARGAGRRARGGVEAPPLVHEAETYGRNRFLERATLALGGLVALGVVVPAAGVAVLPSLGGRRSRPVDLGPIDAFPQGRFVVATFLADPEAGEVSRRSVYVRNNGLSGRRPSFTIMSSRCTHVGCPTQPNGPVFVHEHRSERTTTGDVGLVPALPAGFGCPCHGSQFDNEGNRTAGPAPRALDRYTFSIRDGRLVLGRLYSVSRVVGTGAQARIRSFPHRDAGQPVSGPEAWLYPLAPRS
jgi:Rieske Fe-S protein